MKKDITLTDFEELLETFPFFYKPLNRAYLTLSEYAKRAGVNTNIVRNKIMSGGIPHKHCASTPRTSARDGRRKVLIDWNATSYIFMMSLKPEMRPDDFVRNEDRVYKPIDITDDYDVDVIPFDEQPIQPPRNSVTAKLAHIDNYNDAKLEREKLRILKEEAELKLAENEVVPLADVEAFMVGVAHELKGVIMRAINKACSAMFAGPHVVQKRNTLTGYFQDAFDTLATFADYADELRKEVDFDDDNA